MLSKKLHIVFGDKMVKGELKFSVRFLTFDDDTSRVEVMYYSLCIGHQQKPKKIAAINSSQFSVSVVVAKVFTSLNTLSYDYFPPFSLPLGNWFCHLDPIFLF